MCGHFPVRMYPHRNHHQLVCTVTGCSTLDWHRVLTPLILRFSSSQISFTHPAIYAQWEKKSSLHKLLLSSKAIRVSFSLLICSKLRRKKQPQKDKRKPLSLSSRGGDEPAGTQNTLAQTNTLLQKAVLDVMLPYAFAVMVDLSQTLPAERCRLWLKESIFYSHNQMLPVVLPAETDWRAWVGYSHNRLNTVPFPSVTWKFSLQ